MKKITILFISVLLLSQFSSYSQEINLNTNFIWPIDTANLEMKLSSLFGESRGDHFHNGVDISSDNEKVLSIGDGNVVYSRYATDSPYSNEEGSGNCVWVQHGNGVISAYFHLKDGRVPEITETKTIARGTPVGKSGNTGHSSGSHLHFVTAGEKGRKIINPLTILPIVKDSSSPKIGSLILTIGKKITYINDGDNFNSSTNFPVSVDIFDPGEKKSQRRGVRSILFSFNGKSFKESSFNELSISGGKWRNEDGLTFNELFYENNYFIGNLNFVAGNNSVSIDAIDFSGNKTSKSYSFFVNKIQKKNIIDNK